MDAFRLRDTVVADYAEYVQSFLAILDPRIRAFVDAQLVDGMLWPDPLLQLSPAYQPAETVEALAASGVLHPLSARLFRARGRSLRLHIAKLCQICGYIHDGAAVLDTNRCAHCHTLLDADTSLTSDRIFEMATVAAQRIERITSDEEERVRQGYHLTTHYRFAPEGSGLRRTTVLVRSSAGEPLMELTYAQTATLWRVMICTTKTQRAQRYAVSIE